MLQSLFRPVLRPIMMGVMSVTGSRRALTPSALFTPGTAGFCGGMSVTEAFDAGLMFQDSSGTTPAALEMPVGLVLDQSGGTFNASQSTTTKRPTLSARVNMLTETEDFEAFGWRNWDSSMTVTAGQLDPDGGTTAVLLVPTAEDKYHGFDRLSYFSGIGDNIFRVCVKPSGLRYFFALSGAAQTNEIGTLGACFDLSGAGAVIRTGGWNLSASVELDPSGYYICTLVSEQTTGGLTFGASNSTTWASYVGDGTSGFYFAFPDLRPADSGTNIPPYQRVNTATDYDSAGFPKYLDFDGTDDCFVTPSIDLTGTDKVTVFAGVRTASASTAVMFETSTNSAAAAGATGTFIDTTIHFFGQGSPGGISGSTLSTIATTAPESLVTSGTSDTAAPLNQVRKNGVNGTPSSTAINPGNFGDYPLFIGARNQSDYFFNGRMYTLPIVVGRAVEPALIAEVEAHINAAMGGIY